MNWSKSFRKSVNPSKQRVYAAEAPLHIKQKFLASHLAADLRKKYDTRSLRVIKGDVIKVVRGRFKGKKGTVDRVDTINHKIFVSGFEHAKPDGSKILVPIEASNVVITSVNDTDKRRFKQRG